MKAKKAQSVFEQEKHIFYNVLSLKFREMTKYDLKFLGKRILGLDLQESHKNKFIPLLIGEIYKVFSARHSKNDLFWRIVDFLSHFMTVSLFHEDKFPIFERLSASEMTIRHNQTRPDFTRMAKANLKKVDCILKPNGVCCLCTDDEPIRKVHKCYVCGVKAHKACFFWNDKTKNKRARERQEQIGPQPPLAPKEGIIELGDLLRGSSPSPSPSPPPAASSPPREVESRKSSVKKSTDDAEDSTDELESSFQRPRKSDGLQTTNIFELGADSLTFNTRISRPISRTTISGLNQEMQSRKIPPKMADYRKSKFYYPGKKKSSNKIMFEDKSNLIEEVNINRQARNYPLDLREVDFICPFCVLEQYDPFFEPQEVLIAPRLVRSGDQIPFFVDPSICIGDRFVVVKSIQVSPQYNASQGENYNTYDMYFPKRGTLKVNGVQVRNFKPEKNGYARRKDFPIVCTLSKNYFQMFAEIPQDRLMMVHSVLLEYSDFVRRSGVCDDISKKELLQKLRSLVELPGKQGWEIKFDMLVNHIVPRLTLSNLEILEQNSFQKNFFPDGLFSMLKMTSQGHENLNSHVSLIKGYRACLRLGLNHFQMDFDADYEESPNNCYVVAVYMCKHRTATRHVEKLLQRQAQDGRMLTNYLSNMRYIRNAFKLFDDSFRINVSLLDPLTMTRIRVPVRGDQCCHVNVFCLETYMKNLQNSENRRSKCPFCGKVAVKFIVDFVMLKAINEHRFLSLRQELKDEIIFLRNSDYEIEYFFQKIKSEPHLKRASPPDKFHAPDSRLQIENHSRPNASPETNKELMPTPPNNFFGTKAPESPNALFEGGANEQFSEIGNRRIESGMKFVNALDLEKNTLLLFVWNLRTLLVRYSKHFFNGGARTKAFNLEMILENLNFGCLDVKSLSKVNLGFQIEVFREPKRLFMHPEPPRVLVQIPAKGHSGPPLIAKKFQNLKFVQQENYSLDLRVHDIKAFPYELKYSHDSHQLGTRIIEDVFGRFSQKLLILRMKSIRQSLNLSHKTWESKTRVGHILETVPDALLLKCLHQQPFNFRSALVGELAQLATMKHGEEEMRRDSGVKCGEIQTSADVEHLPLTRIFKMKCKRRMMRIMRFPYLSAKKTRRNESKMTSYENSRRKRKKHMIKSKEKKPRGRLEDIFPETLKASLRNKQRPRMFFIVRRSIKKKRTKPTRKKMNPHRYTSPESSFSEHVGRSEEESSAYSIKNCERGKYPEQMEEAEMSYMGRRTRGRRIQRKKWKKMQSESVHENEFVPRSDFNSFPPNSGSFVGGRAKGSEDAYLGNFVADDDADSRDNLMFEQQYGQNRSFGKRGLEIQEIGYRRRLNRDPKKKKKIHKRFSMGKGYNSDLLADSLNQRKAKMNKKKRRKRFRLYEIAKMEMERMYGSIRKGAKEFEKPRPSSNLESEETSNHLHQLNKAALADSVEPIFDKSHKKGSSGNLMGININGNNIDFNDLGFDPGTELAGPEKSVYVHWNEKSSEDLTRENQSQANLRQESGRLGKGYFERTRSGRHGKEVPPGVPVENVLNLTNGSKDTENEVGGHAQPGQMGHAMQMMTMGSLRRFKKVTPKKDITFNSQDLTKLVGEMGFDLDLVDRFLKRNQVYFKMIEHIQKTNLVDVGNRTHSAQEQQIVDMFGGLCRDEQLTSREIIEAYYENIKVHKEVFRRAYATKHDNKKKRPRGEFHLDKESGDATEHERNEAITVDEERPIDKALFTKKNPAKTWRNFTDFAKRFRANLKIKKKSAPTWKRPKFDTSGDQKRRFSKTIMEKLAENVGKLRMDYGFGRRGKKALKKKSEMLGEYSFIYDNLACNLERFKYVEGLFSQELLKLYLRRAMGQPFFARSRMRERNYFMEQAPPVQFGGLGNLQSQPSALANAFASLGGEESAGERAKKEQGRAKTDEKGKEEWGVLDKLEKNASFMRIEVKNKMIILTNLLTENRFLTRQNLEMKEEPKEKKKSNGGRGNKIRKEKSKETKKKRKRDLLGKREDFIFKEEEKSDSEMVNLGIFKLEDDLEIRDKLKKVKEESSSERKKEKKKGKKKEKEQEKEKEKGDQIDINWREKEEEKELEKEGKDGKEEKEGKKEEKMKEKKGK